MLFSLICFEGDLSSHYSANELCLVALTLYLVWSSESPTSGVFILKATIWNCFLLIRIAWLCRSLCFKSVHDICFTKFVVSILFRLFSLNMCKAQDLSTLPSLHPYMHKVDMHSRTTWIASINQWYPQAEWWNFYRIFIHAKKRWKQMCQH